ncbi:hypothetical protein BC831DRAFT_460472 [Entophlyctis helioformis]|nr:hypothetical protein BC831DRAFT_460472 [Entophlyctis helioformis]
MTFARTQQTEPQRGLATHQRQRKRQRQRRHTPCLSAHLTSAMTVFLVLLVLVVHTPQAAGLENSFYTGAEDVSYLRGSRDMYPRNTSSDADTSLAKGEARLVFMRIVRGDMFVTANRRLYTGVYFPKVDDYTTMSVPSSWAILETDTSSTASANLSLVLYYGGRPISLPFRQWNIRNFGQNYYIAGRTALATLDEGRLVGFDWAPTACVLTSCVCLDSICADYCPSRNCNVTVRLAWTGTDRNKNVLRSYDRDVWRLQNV